MERAGRRWSEKGGKEGGRERRTDGAPSLRTAGSGPARVLPGPPQAASVEASLFPTPSPVEPCKGLL